MIPPRLAAEIRRLAEVEGWPVGRIAHQLGVHHSTVRRALQRAETLAARPSLRSSELDRFLPWLRKLLERYPTLPASQLHEMARRRGYPGGPDHFRHRLAELGLRPRKAPEAFLELRTLPAEQAQVDWADFGSRKVVGGQRRLFAFVMVLSYSRYLFVRFFYDARLPSFLAGHVAAFDTFGGVAKQLLYDNLKSAVLERIDDGIRFHPRLLELADYYRFEPRPVAPYRGNEKGRVERAIRYLRGAFFPLRSHLALEALNDQARQWCREEAAWRRWPQDRGLTVEQAFRQEQPLLLPLPPDSFPAHETVEAVVRRTPYVAFDANRYSIPHQHIDRTLTVRADLERVRLFDRELEIACHRRSWDKGQVLEDPQHIEVLRQAKRRARLHRGQHRLLRNVPAAETLLVELGKRQRHLATAVERLLRLLDEHGRDELALAIAEALAAGSPHPETVRLILDRRRAGRSQPPPLAIELPDDPRLRDLVVVPHPLADYDPEDES
ncbi:MAG TPA: IS21 family transposase [Thermoanaerobaculia bacterium]|nr:IS21 family transposase [Thermoanaerobaculia bacterium]